MIRRKFNSEEERKEAQKLYQKEYSQKEKRKLYVREYSLNHKKEAKEYRENHKEEKKLHDKEYHQTHKKERNEYLNNKRKTDINFKLAWELRIRGRLAIKNNQKAGSFVRDLDCTIPELKLYLESRFQPGMTWDNWSRTGWHIDHIIPLDSFDLSNRGEFLKACHYTNLQPLWAEENYKKGKTINNIE